MMKFSKTASALVLASAFALGSLAPASAGGNNGTLIGEGWANAGGGGYAIGSKTGGVSQSQTGAKLKLGGDCGCNTLTVKAANFTGMEASGKGFSKVGSNSAVQVGGYMKGSVKHGKK